MKRITTSCLALSISATALLAACGGSQPPTSVAGAMLQTHALATHADRGTSWMLPDAKSKDLLYISDIYDVTVYSYPQGKLEGKLRGFYEIAGECVDSKGDIFVVNTGAGKIVEYAHGGKQPIETLQAATYTPAGCSIDPTTGNLAVANVGDIYGGNVAIYPNAQGQPTTYTDPDVKAYVYCGYDNKGNLFIDGWNSSYQFAFAELTQGGGSLKTVTLNQQFKDEGGVQWDGKYVAVADSSTPDIYRFSINGSQGTLVGTTSLGSGADDPHQFFILDNKVIVPNFYLVGSQAESDVLFYHYPAGGTAYKTISKGVKASEGAVVSKASK